MSNGHSACCLHVIGSPKSFPLHADQGKASVFASSTQAAHACGKECAVGLGGHRQ
jgi:hypothetical protein